MVLVALLPLWFPWLLPTLARNNGLSYGRFERVGYAQLRLHQVAWSNPSGKAEAETVQFFQPSAWAWKSFVRDPANSVPFVVVRGWSWQKSSSTQTNKPPVPFPALWQKLDAALPTVNKWLPRARLEVGNIKIAESTIAISEIVWQSRQLRGTLQTQRPAALRSSDAEEETITWTIHMPETGARVLKTSATPSGISAQFEARLEETARTQVLLNGQVNWRTNEARITAQFDSSGWIPVSARVHADKFRIPNSLAHLEAYEDPIATLFFDWTGEQFTLDLSASARPKEQNELPSVDMVCRATGNLERVQIETLHATTPWLQTELSNPVAFSLDGRWISAQAALRFAADLSQQQWIPASGKLHGTTLLRPGEAEYPSAHFQFRGQELAFQDLVLQTIETEGDLEWPAARLSRVTIELNDGSRITASGGANLAGKSLTNVVVEGAGPFRLKQIPAGIQFTNLVFALRAHGPWMQPHLSGAIELQQFRAKALAESHVKASWQGTHRTLPELQVEMHAGASLFRVRGAATVTTNQIELALISGELRTADRAPLILSGPTRIEIQRHRARTNGDAPDLTSIRLTPFHWRNDTSELISSAEIRWPVQGQASVTATNLTPALVQDFLTNRIPNVVLKRAHLEGRWRNGPLEGRAEVRGTWPMKEGKAVTAGLQLRLDTNQTEIAMFEVLSPSADPVIIGRGTLPIRIDPGDTKLLQVRTNAQIAFEAATRPHETFWNELAAWSRLKLAEPHADVVVRGTLDRPEGTVNLKARSVAFEGIRRDLPKLESVEARLDIERALVKLHALRFSVAGQPVAATGEFPVSQWAGGSWNERFRWRQATARLQMSHASLSELSALFPEMISPRGTLDLNMHLERGGNLSGALVISNAATRPIRPLGPIQEIHTRLIFREQKLDLENFSARIGGERLYASGYFDLAPEAWRNQLPGFLLKLHGTNVPLARQPDLILRSDLALELANHSTNPPVLSGAVTLRDSFFLSDLKMLVPGRVVHPKRRPPYFSFEKEPFDSWRLDLRVRGDRFLTVRSPLFRGEASANFKVEGTFREPIALGEATVNSGLIQFPFANLRVTQGLVSLTSADLYRPQLFLTAGARTFGYDLKMDVTGPADEPLIEFSSTPPLSSEEIVLMLTTGELPRNELTFSGQQKASRLALFLGRSLWSKFTGGGEGRGGERLTIRSGENVSETGRQTYSVEYRLTEDWSLVAEYDRFNQLNAGVKWRIYSR
ncbi:MAG: translocation/assembly module TamB domain-containing protein [Verrucomicrobiota bacterium]